MSSYPTKIVLAIDASVEARLAATHAVELATMTQSELHVVHVGLLSQWVHPDTLSVQQLQRLKDEAQKRLDAGIKAIEAAGGTIAQSYLRLGRVDTEVIRLVEEIGGGLVVVGNRGSGALARIMLGVDAESIVRHAPCPVLVVRSQD